MLGCSQNIMWYINMNLNVASTLIPWNFFFLFDIFNDRHIFWKGCMLIMAVNIDWKFYAMLVEGIFKKLGIRSDSDCKNPHLREVNRSFQSLRIQNVEFFFKIIYLSYKSFINRQKNDTFSIFSKPFRYFIQVKKLQNYKQLQVFWKVLINFMSNGFGKNPKKFCFSLIISLSESEN